MHVKQGGYKVRVLPETNAGVYNLKEVTIRHIVNDYDTLDFRDTPVIQLRTLDNQPFYLFDLDSDQVYFFANGYVDADEHGDVVTMKNYNIPFLADVDRKHSSKYFTGMYRIEILDEMQERAQFFIETIYYDVISDSDEDGDDSYDDYVGVHNGE
jgi:hypothetical protein